MGRPFISKIWRYFIHFVTVGLISSPGLRHVPNERLTIVQFYYCEPHCEPLLYSDYNELNREMRTAAVSGMNKIKAYPENSSTEESY